MACRSGTTTATYCMQSLGSAVVSGLGDPEERLCAIVLANFDETFMSAETCRVWTQFWAYAPYHSGLSRLQKLNKKRVKSHLTAELKRQIPEQSVSTMVGAIQAFMDGVWVQLAQSNQLPDIAQIQKRAREFLSHALSLRSQAAGMA